MRTPIRTGSPACGINGLLRGADGLVQEKELREYGGVATRCRGQNLGRPQSTRPRDDRCSAWPPIRQSRDAASRLASGLWANRAALRPAVLSEGNEYRPQRIRQV